MGSVEVTVVQEEEEEDDIILIMVDLVMEDIRSDGMVTDRTYLQSTKRGTHIRYSIQNVEAIII